jgi:hypothetical protein
MDVWEYFATRERECSELSLHPECSFAELCAEEKGSNGTRGMIFGKLTMTADAYLQISESVVVTGTGVHREEYSYFLVYDGYEMWGYERDLSHEPAEHGHVGRGHERVPAGSVTFREAAEKAWETVSREEGLRV